ncbi:hypothetical protein F7725_014756 [Dissostichus mawsoni]|uniref:Uncharacterized protein n=1 Tax=Dissostichus mawsoni TaxID=36200 RepID=A0A7J5Z170_DISMA|nr:hypothetical protein F7725_014756 [Dissostichus mawsoni]
MANLSILRGRHYSNNDLEKIRHIVLVNSIQGRLAVPFRSSYAASKHAVQAFFDCLRAEVKEYGIEVSTISHTFINASEPPPEEGPAPKTNAVAAFIRSQLVHGVSPRSWPMK